jgi:cellulose synthase/poly-beta-1,6-N-acetylglucosamine synthase-like glycosyltransferase
MPVLIGLFWILVFIMIATYAGYPLFLYLLSFRKRNRPIEKSTFNPRVCLIVSAYNEEKVIGEKIENSLRLDYPALEVVVVSDGSTDKTVGVCQKFLPKIKLFHFTENSGKNEALNNALAQIDADIIVFSDANAFYDSNAIERLVCHYTDSRVGCVVGNLQLRQTDISDVGKGEGLYWRYEHRLKILESRFGSLLIGNGSIFSARRELIEKIDTDVANDFQVPLRIAAGGYRVLYEPTAIAYEKTASDRKEEFNRKVRIVNRGIRGAWRMRKYLRGFRLFEFIFHKFLRWLSGIALTVIFVISAILSGNPFFFGMFLLQTVFYMLAMIGHMTGSKKKVFYVPFYFALVNLAATKALIKFFLREKYTSWESPQTAR